MSLIQGELFKLNKSRLLGIMCASLAAVIALFSAFYARSDGNILDKLTTELNARNAVSADEQALSQRMANRQRELEYFAQSGFEADYIDYIEQLFGELDLKWQQLERLAQEFGASSSAIDFGLMLVGFEQFGALYQNILQSYLSPTNGARNHLLLKRQGLLGVPREYEQLYQGFIEFEIGFAPLREQLSTLLTGGNLNVQAFYGGVQFLLERPLFGADYTALFEILNSSLRGNITKKAYQKYIEPHLGALNGSASQMQAFDELIDSVTLLEIVRQNKLDDAELAAYKGMLFCSRYAVRERAAVAQYELRGGKTQQSSGKSAQGFMAFCLPILSMLLVIFCVALTAWSIAGEYGKGTMALVLSRPHSRASVLGAKLIASARSGAGLVLFSFLACFAIGALCFGTNAPSAFAVFDAWLPLSMPAIAMRTLEFGATLLTCMVYCALAACLCCLLRSKVAAVASCALLYFAASVLSPILGRFGFYRYLLFNNANLGAYFSGGSSLGNMSFWFSLALCLAHILLFLTISFTAFIKRDV